MISRAQRTPFGEWWWTVDRLTLAAIGALMLAGIVLSLAASPPVAARLGLDPFFFVNRHILYVLPAIAVMLSVSFLSPRQIRRLSLMIFVVSLIMVAATPYFGPEIKGARRWLVLLGVNIQPSEFIKPAFVIIVAWLFGESSKRPDMPANTFSLILLLTVIALLVVQPDFGQTMLFLILIVPNAASMPPPPRLAELPLIVQLVTVISWPVVLTWLRAPPLSPVELPLNVLLATFNAPLFLIAPPELNTDWLLLNVLLVTFAVPVPAARLPL